MKMSSRAFCRVLWYKFTNCIIVLMMEAGNTSETLVEFYQTTQSKILENNRLLLQILFTWHKLLSNSKTRNSFIQISSSLRFLKELLSQPCKAKDNDNMNHAVVEIKQALRYVLKTVAWLSKLGPRLSRAGRHVRWISMQKHLLQFPSDMPQKGIRPKRQVTLCAERRKPRYCVLCWVQWMTHCQTR